jgi:signal transduction histidine kinase
LSLRCRQAGYGTWRALIWRFVAITSHELLTPIVFIVGFASTLEDGILGPLAPSQAEAVGKILAGAERLTRMVRNTLEYSYLEAGQLAIHPDQVDLAEIARNATEPRVEQAAESGVALDLALPAGAVPAWTDPDRTGQLLTELLDNALKFTPQGGRVRVAVRETPDGAVCEVSDTGPGIPPDALGRLAQPFYQLDSTMTRRHGGLGLGLALAYGLARLLKGRLEVRSAVGQGTTFRLVLPASGP